MMQVTYVARSTLDYRIPVLESLYEKLDGRFTYIYSADYVPGRVHDRLQRSLGNAAVGLRGELRIGPNETEGFANRAVRIVYQPGIWRAIRQTKPDVLIGDGFFQWTSFALAYRALRRVGLVVCYERTFHTERAAQWIRTAYRRWVMRYVDALACNGVLSKDYSMFLGAPEKRITLGQMAADTHVLSARTAAVTATKREETRRSWGAPEVALVTVGRLNARKGVNELLTGWALLETRRQGNWHLIIVGDGEDSDALRRKAAELGLNGVTFLGHVDYDDIAPIYAAADALVMPTLEDNWSLVVPEAMACGLPVLCSVYNGCHPELIEPDGNGWVFDPTSAEETYTALSNCIAHKDHLAEMGGRSRAIVSAFTPEHAAAAILEACRIAYGHIRR